MAGKQDIIQLLDALDVRPNSRLGQNFLVDPNLLDAMLADSAPQADECILEVGPGTGVLTERLLEHGCRVTAVEIDHRLAAHLQTRFADSANLRLLRADACGVDYDAVMGSGPYRCLANLPYACSSVLLARFLAADNPPRELYVLLQREMAQRLAAAPGTKSYGALSVRVQLAYEVCLLRRVPREVFFPPPEVGSSYVRLRLRSDRPMCELRNSVDRVVRTGFSQRRKKLVKLLGAVFGVDRAREAVVGLGLAETVRAEELAPAVFVELAERLADPNRP